MYVIGKYVFMERAFDGWQESAKDFLVLPRHLNLGLAARSGGGWLPTKVWAFAIWGAVARPARMDQTSPFLLGREKKVTAPRGDLKWLRGGSWGEWCSHKFVCSEQNVNKLLERARCACDNAADGPFWGEEW